MLLLFIATAFVGCSKDDENARIEDQPTNIDIVGTWRIVNIVEPDGSALVLNECDNAFKTDFLSTGVLTDYYNCSGSISEDNMGYNVSGDVLTVVAPNETPNGQDVTVRYKIKERTASSLKVKTVYNSIDGDVNGNTIFYAPYAN